MGSSCTGLAAVFGGRARTVLGALIGALLGALSWENVAAAQPSPAGTGARNPAAAQALYDEARQLVTAGDFAHACPKFKESYRIDPGGGTLLNLADCYEKQGKTALAWSTFKEALVMAQRDGRADRADFANAHIASLESRMTRLTVHVAPEAKVAGLSVTIDGEPLGEAAWDVAMPIDPGDHVVRAAAPGKAPFAAALSVAATGASKARVEIPPLAAASNPPPASTEQRPPISEAPTPSRGASPLRTVGWVVGGVGVASIGVGSYFGLRAFSRWSDRNGACMNGCTQAARTAGDDARTAATISTIGFVAGAAALGVGVYLVVSGSGGPQHAAQSSVLHVEPAAFADRGGLSLRGSW